MFVGGKGGKEEIYSSVLGVEGDLQKYVSATIKKLADFKHGWAIAAELLYYFWKVKTTVEAREHGVIEEVDLSADKVKPDYEHYLLPPEVAERLSDLMSGPPEENPLLYLVSIGLLEAEEYDRVLRCPKCGSFRIRTRLVCPYCNSFKVTPTRLIQHTLCGYSGPEAEFVKEKEKICPSCGAKLEKEGVDYVIFGRIFYCASCKRIFKTPKIMLTCENKETLVHEPGFTFDPIDADYVSLKRYKITEKGIEMIESGELIMESISRYIMEERPELQVFRKEETTTVPEVPAEVRRLGFTLLIRNPETNSMLAVDIVTGDIVPFIMKATILKTAPDIKYVLLATPAVLDSVSALEGYAEGVTIIDVTDYSLRELAEHIISEVQ